MIEGDAELTNYGEMMLDFQPECEFCGRSIVVRFGGLWGSNECSSCKDDFRRLNDAGKLEWG